eukprot:TRINITY_DN1558_c0_g1_i1.p1 TRINITY_DN1558_c0_g1~~TRINITY_DN1558_c0_g1_i1.p1  ORF type:complete len:551 (+),score=132.59 TRINITY_DN1558_c0_g1_i1:55-1707(+)
MDWIKKQKKEKKEKKGKDKDKKQKKEKKQKKQAEMPAKGEVKLKEFGITVDYDNSARASLGPIIGKVTTDSAIVLFECTDEVPVTVHFVPFIKNENGEVEYQGKKEVTLVERMERNVPKSFKVTGLHPNTAYRVIFSGVSEKAIKSRQAIVRTLPTKITKLSFAAFSCDRPERVLDGETNMWDLLEQKALNEEVPQIFLHLGDQVYGQKELVDAYVILRQSHQDGMDDEAFKAVSGRCINRLADIYRFTWNLPHTAGNLALGQHLMIWSDNDLYNDFTIAKTEHGTTLANLMIHYGHLAYRRYQRQLWDVDYQHNPTAYTGEEHFHKYGPVGVIMIDMRGSRLDWRGNQLMDNPFINETQWKMINGAFEDPEIKVMLICNEIPFVGDPPETIKQNAAKPETEFLKDHWGYRPDELVKILELAFDWKAANPDREIVFLGGDIHVGVESVITDAKTGLSAKQLTATPITNHVCKFFPALQGKVNDRFSYTHKPVDRRNYGLIDISIDETGKATVDNCKLILDPKDPQQAVAHNSPIQVAGHSVNESVLANIS